MVRATFAAAMLAGGVWLTGLSGASAQQAIPCAPEGGYCRVPYPMNVVFGVPGRASARFVSGRGIPCNTQVFGDPAYGVPKTCWLTAPGAPYPYHRGPRHWRGPHQDLSAPPLRY